LKNLIGTLKSLNRKERFFLVGAALDKPDFQLGKEYARVLSKWFKLDVPYKKSWVAMDYHLDWISTALHVTHNQLSLGEPWLNPNQSIVKGTQEDVDLIVGFERAGTTVLLLVEAKAATRWTASQQQSKSDRLTRIFGAKADRYPGVEPHFALTSPSRPDDDIASRWPCWMAPEGPPIWFPLTLHPDRRRVVRCDENGRSNKDGEWAVVKPDKISKC
jgi:hypothetical protein